ncbi:tyrosine-type recombinase/integrase [Mesorhizobium sp. M0028]|uniref:tyrosine-type recombinase/integrase n=1 Tax=Mesorhizobium sp. M0028 TaxID=2956849 RepID=UPI00333508A3
MRRISKRRAVGATGHCCFFLAPTGARVSEALGANACDLQLDRPRPQVLLRGKRRKERVVPIPDDLVKALRVLMTERGANRQEARPLFVGIHETRLTRRRAAGRRHSHVDAAGTGAQIHLASCPSALARDDATAVRVTF